MSRTRFRVNPHSIVALMSNNSLVGTRELLAQNKRDIWSLSDYKGSRANNHLVHQRIPNHIAKLTANVWVFVYQLIVCEFDFRYKHLHRNYMIKYTVLEYTVDGINYKCWKDTNISENMLYLKITWIGLSDRDRNAMYWKSTSTYANEIALTPTKVFNTYVFI